MSLQFFILPSGFGDELRLMFVCFGGFFEDLFMFDTKSDEGRCKARSCCESPNRNRNMATAAPQVQTPLRLVGWERRQVSCDEPKPTRSKVPAVTLRAAAISSDSEAPMRRLCSRKLSECIMGNVFYCS